MPQIKEDIVIDASPEKVWTVLGERFGDVALWAGSIQASKMITPELRECQSIMGRVRERLLEFDPHARCLEYEAVKGPNWFRRASNRWCVDDLGDGHSRVRMHAQISLQPVYGHVMMLLSAPRMRTLSRSLSDLKRYVESDESQRSRANTHGDVPEVEIPASAARATSLRTRTVSEGEA